MKSILAIGAAVVAAACISPAFAADAVVTSGTGLVVTSGTGVTVAPGTRMVLIPGATIRNGEYIGSETLTVGSASNTAIMGAPAGSVVTVQRYAGPVPPANGYLAGDYARYLALGR